jgi:hypothetical protein
MTSNKGKLKDIDFKDQQDQRIVEMKPVATRNLTNNSILVLGELGRT